MKIKLRILISILVVISIIAIGYWQISGPENIKDLPEIIESGRLSVLTEKSSVGFKLQKDTVSGFQYEIIKAFADSLGLELVISQQNDIKKSIESLKDGDVQIVANFTPITTEFINDVNFTNSILNSKLVLIQQEFTNSENKSSININTQIDLAGDTIFIPFNSGNYLRLKHLAREIADSIYIIEIKNTNTEEVVKLISEGKVKYTICPEHLARKMKLQYENINISLPISFTQGHGWMVNKESPQLLLKLNDFLEDFIGSSHYWELYRKYYK
jgi:membrane-bound lytic murein transglycosylase MltF